MNAQPITLHLTPNLTLQMRYTLFRLLRMKRLQTELEIRFQTSLEPTKSSSKGRGQGGKQQYRRGDLQDPRCRTKRHLDVIVQAHTHHTGAAVTCKSHVHASGGDGEYPSGSKDVVRGMVIRQQPPFVVLALKVEGQYSDQSEMVWESEGKERIKSGTARNLNGNERVEKEDMDRSREMNMLQECEIQETNTELISDSALRAETGTEMETEVDTKLGKFGGHVVLGYFRPDTFTKMGISVAVGQRLRIYDAVLLSGLRIHTGHFRDSMSSMLSTEEAVGVGDEERGLAILLCTSLCESL